MFIPYDVLSRVRASPERYIGCRCYANLSAFFCGYQFIPSNDLIWLDFHIWTTERGTYPHQDPILVRHFTRESYDAFLREFDACLKSAGKDARDSSKWPTSALRREDIPSKRPWLVNNIALRQRPVMYFGPDARLGQLLAFVSGYDLSISDLGQQPDSLNLDDFGEWLRARLELSHRERWDRMVESICNGGPFECFFTLLDHYLETEAA